MTAKVGTDKTSGDALSTPERTTQLLEHLPCGILVVEADGTISLANKESERILGYSREEIIGMSINGLVPEAMRSRHDQLRLGFNEKPVPRAMGAGKDLYALRKDGTLVSVEIGLSPISENLKTQVLCCISDITDRKLMQDELESHTQDLERSNAELDVFAYTVAHDLKEPLRGILTLIEFAKEDCSSELEEQIQGYLDRMNGQGRQMLSLIDTLLAYSRLGRSKVKPALVEMVELVNDVKLALSSLIQESGASIEIASDLPSAECDRVLVKEIFLNLICNAIRYNRSPEKMVKVWYDSQRAAYAVTDNGPGISEERQAEVFSVFSRGPNPEETESGNGLGLSIVRRLVQKHQGNVWLESKLGSGSTFFFSLNLVPTQN